MVAHLRMRDDDSTIGFAIAGGAGEFFDQSKLLIRSINLNIKNPYHVTIFVPKEDASQLTPEQMKFYEKHGRVVVGNYPIKEYKFSAKYAALNKAQERKADLYITLDCDTLFLDGLSELTERRESDTDLLLCPEHGGWTYWATPAAREEWREVYALIGAEFPGYTMQAAFGGTSMPPYWNGGVVITRRKIADEWLELVQKVRRQRGPDTFYAEQLALSLLGRQHGVTELPFRYNYPSYMFLRCPTDAKIIHYDSLWHLARIVNPKIRQKLAEIGAYEMEAVPQGRAQIRAIGHGVGVRIFREIVRKRWPRLKRALGR